MKLTFSIKTVSSEFEFGSCIVNLPASEKVFMVTIENIQFVFSVISDKVNLTISYRDGTSAYEGDKISERKWPSILNIPVKRFTK